MFQTKITETFLLKNKVAALTRRCLDEDTCPAVKYVASKLDSARRFLHTHENLHKLGSDKCVTLSVHEIIAIEELLDPDVVNRSAVDALEIYLWSYFIFKPELCEIQAPQ